MLLWDWSVFLVKEISEVFGMFLREAWGGREGGIMASFWSVVMLVRGGRSESAIAEWFKLVGCIVLVRLRGVC